MSCEFVLSNIRSAERGLWTRIWKAWKHRPQEFSSDTLPPLKKVQRRSKNNKKKVIANDKKKKNSFGGAWRAFIQKRCARVCKVVFKELAIEYRQLTDDERAAFKMLGQHGTYEHRVGRTSFGEVARKLVRTANYRDLVRRGQQPDTNDTMHLETNVVALCADHVSHELMTISADSKILMHLKRSREEYMNDKVDAWHCDSGIVRRDQSLDALPQLCKQATSFIGIFGISNYLKWRCPIGIELPRIIGLCRESAYRNIYKTFITD